MIGTSAGPRRQAAARGGALLAGVAGAGAGRAAVPAASPEGALLAGVLFAGALLGLAACARAPIAEGGGDGMPAPRPEVRPASRLALVPALGVGLAGGAMLCAFPAAHRLSTGLHLPLPPAGDYVPWAATLVLISIAEEVALRGALFDAVAEVAGAGLAVALGAVAFALLHVPRYGWAAVPLDLGVGVALGCLRLIAGRAAAPAAAHAIADLAGWWL